MVFSCPSCGLGLSVGTAMAGVEGPCPRCGVVIAAPRATAEVEVIPPSWLPRKKGGGVSLDPRGRSSGGRKGLISADSVVDHRHQGHKETTRTLFILSMFILAFFACLVATWFLKDWMAR